jgi:hypothetical protein
VGKHEAKAFAEEWVARLERLDWADVERYVEAAHEKDVTLASGASYRVKVYAFWDAEPRRSSLVIGALVYPEKGLRRRFGYRAYGGKDEDDLPAEWPLSH